jgi:uncharacterized membrane protein
MLTDILKRSREGEMVEQMTHKRQLHSMILFIVLALDIFVLGGFAVLLMVNRLLHIQLGIYAQYINDASVIIDFMDDLFPYHITYYGAMSVLAVLTVATWAWSKPQSRVLRYSAALLCLILIATIAWLTLGRSATITAVPSVLMMPTPVVRPGG